MTEVAIYNTLLAGWFVLAAITFVVLLRLAAPYGRHAQPGWGMQLPNRLGWILMEAPAVLVMAWCLAVGSPSRLVWFFGALWLVHYVHRAFIFPFRLRSTGKHMPLAVAGSGLLFNIGNAYLNGRGLTVFHAYPDTWWQDPRFLVGLAIFGAGLAINLHADTVLLNLRRPGDKGYRVPSGGLYRWVSCPNYLGEIMEWTGWALATWSLPGLAFALWTAANLVPRALAHHRWYVSHFDDYPRRRRALLPRLL